MADTTKEKQENVKMVSDGIIHHHGKEILSLKQTTQSDQGLLNLITNLQKI